MVDSSSATLLSQIKQRQQRIRLGPVVARLSVVIALATLASSAQQWITIAVIILAVMATTVTYHIDQFRKTVVLMYDLDGPMLSGFEALSDALDHINCCRAVWHVSARGNVIDARYHAGAGEVVQRKSIRVVHADPPYICTNIPVPSIPLGSSTIYFLPDHVLFSTHEGIGAIGYDSLAVRIGTVRFIEDGSVPADADVVDRTWRYVNKNGTPDRRFNANRELPVCEYETLHVTSATGLNEHFQLSQVGASQRLEIALGGLVDAIALAKHAEALRAERERDEVRRRLAETASMAAAATNAAARTSPVPSLHEALLDLLCCVMSCDGRASTREKRRIVDIMAKVGAPWDDSEVLERIDAFIARLHLNGHSAVFASSLGHVSLFTRAGKEGTLLKAIDLVAKADGEIDCRERELCSRIRTTLHDAAQLAS